MASFTKTIHKEPYPAISPCLPSLSQAGKTVLITGGSTGIGYAIARAFLLASASKILILGRRADLIATAISRLMEEMPDFRGEIVGRPCDVSDSSDVAALWADLEERGIVVDVLVLNAARIGKPGPIIQVGLGEVWADYVMNVQANLDLAERFFKHNAKAANGKKKVGPLAPTSGLVLFDLRRILGGR
jgi:NAD(P)-dependent dehydrogenase (short-subunit alcohol dehydrogenase family)